MSTIKAVNSDTHQLGIVLRRFCEHIACEVGDWLYRNDSAPDELPSISGVASIALGCIDPKAHKVDAINCQLKLQRRTEYKVLDIITLLSYMLDTLVAA